MGDCPSRNKVASLEHVYRSILDTFSGEAMYTSTGYCLETALEKCGLVNWPAWHDLSSVGLAVKLQTYQPV